MIQNTSRAVWDSCEVYVKKINKYDVHKLLTIKASWNEIILKIKRCASECFAKMIKIEYGVAIIREALSDESGNMYLR